MMSIGWQLRGSWTVGQLDDRAAAQQMDSEAAGVGQLGDSRAVERMGAGG